MHKKCVQLDFTRGSRTKRKEKKKDIKGAKAAETKTSIISGKKGKTTLFYRLKRFHYYVQSSYEIGLRKGFINK